jgi:MSHA pilin protein MshC
MLEQSSKTTDKRGFTLLELIAALVVFAVIAAVVISRMQPPTGSLYAETNTVKSDLRYAQLKALQCDDSTITWGMQLNAGSITLLKNGSAWTNPLPGETGSTHTLASGVTLSSSASTVTFNSWGSPGAGNVTITLTQGSSTQSITITSGTGYIP